MNKKFLAAVLLAFITSGVITAAPAKKQIKVTKNIVLEAKEQEDTTKIKKDTIDRYLIDKQVIERFDGSQLEGKTISKYMIAYKHIGNIVEKKHIIITEKQGIPMNEKPVRIMKYDGLIIVDGKEMTFNDISNLKTDEIASMEIYKADSKVATSYGVKRKDGVMMITTKANKTLQNVYFVDGERVKKEDVDKLSPNKIASMNISKKDGFSVVNIITKK